MKENFVMYHLQYDSTIDLSVSQRMPDCKENPDESVFMLPITDVILACCIDNALKRCSAASVYNPRCIHAIAYFKIW